MKWLPALNPQRLRQLWYVPLLVSSMGLMFVRILLMARVLDVTNFAQFSGGLLASSTFGMLGCLGLYSMYQRDLPVMLVRRRLRRGYLLLTQCFIVTGVLGLMVVAVAVAGVAPSGWPPGLLAIGALHGVSQQVFLLITVESRSRGEPLHYAMQNLTRTLGVVIAGIVVAILTNSAALTLVVETFVSLVFTAAVLWKMFRGAAIRISTLCVLATRQFKNLRWRSAIPLMLVGMAGFVLLNGDRWLAAEVVSGSQFAQYSFAWTVLMIAQALQAVINASVFPLLARRFATFGRYAVFMISVRISTVMLIVVGLLAIPLWIGLDASIIRWYPHYEPAQALVPLFLAIAVFRISDFWSSFMIVVGLERQVLWVNVIAGFLGGGGWLVVTEPWQSPTYDLSTIGLLALFFTLANYLLMAMASWLAAKNKRLKGTFFLES